VIFRSFSSKSLRATVCGLIGAAAVVSLATPRQACSGVVIVHSNDILGELEPCGCRTNPLGGMPRKANLLKRISAGEYGALQPAAADAPGATKTSRHPNELIQLDAGDLLFSSDSLPELLAKQSELQASFLLRSMDELHHDAIVPGEKEFALGWKTFQRLRAQAKVKFLAANLKLAKGGHAPFEAHAIFTRTGDDGKPIRVGVFGIVGDQLHWPKELKAQEPIAAARAEVAALKGKTDIIVALTHEGLEQDVALAKAVPGIDIIIGGHTQSFLQTPAVVNGTHIYQSSFRNQYIGVLPISQPYTGTGYDLIGLDAGFDSPEKEPNSTDVLVKQFKEGVAKLNLAEAELEEKAAPHALLESKYQTWPRCAECHLKQYDFWRKTPHARALEPLIHANQVANKECISCHTVGLGDARGFRNIAHLAELRVGDQGATQQLTTPDLESFLERMSKAKDLDEPVSLTQTDPPLPLRQALNRIDRAWTPVQCENCHQPGEDHPFNSGYAKAVETTRCLQCHTAERAPDWYTKDGKLDEKVAAQKKAMMTCPAGGDIAPQN
jgi:hypothetical protein